VPTAGLAEYAGLVSITLRALYSSASTSNSLISPLFQHCLARQGAGRIEPAERYTASPHFATSESASEASKSASEASKSAGYKQDRQDISKRGSAKHVASGCVGAAWRNTRGSSLMLPQVPPGGSSRRHALSAPPLQHCLARKGLAVFNRSAHSAGPGSGQCAVSDKQRAMGSGH